MSVKITESESGRTFECVRRDDRAHGAITAEQVYTFPGTNRHTCRLCDQRNAQDYAAKRNGGVPPTPRQRRPQSPIAHLAGPTRESVLSMIEALDLLKAASESEDASSQKGVSPLQRATALSVSRKATIDSALEVLGRAVAESGLAEVAESAAPLAALLGSE
jgi:hypothetical protein